MQFQSGVPTDRATAKKIAYYLAGDPPPPVTFGHGAEAREALTTSGVLPASAPTKPRVAMAANLATFHKAACTIIASHPIAFARQVADSADSDPRLVAALRTILALPAPTRDQVVQRSSRRRAG